MVDSKAVQEFLKNCPDRTIMDKPFIIRWSRPHVGFGEFCFYFNADGSIVCDNEAMPKDFVKRVLCDLVDEAKFNDDR